MNIEVRDLITLSDNNKYVVSSKTNYNGINYYCLVDINKAKNLMFCYEDKDELVEINDKELVNKLLSLFYESSKGLLNYLINK